jgi:hypothetical protein
MVGSTQEVREEINEQELSLSVIRQEQSMDGE